MATNSISLLTIPPTYTKPFKNSSSYQLILKPNNQFGSLIGTQLSVHRRCATSHLRRPTVATVSLSLPTTVPEKAPAEKSSKWSARAIKSFAMAELEARKLKYPKTGTEALLMGILVEGTSIAAKTLRASGVTLFKVRDETVNLLGKSDMYFFSPEHPPLTEQAQRALDWAVEEKLKSGEDGEVTVSHMLLGIWSEKDSAGHKLMESLGFDNEKAKELAKSMDRDIVLSFK